MQLDWGGGLREFGVVSCNDVEAFFEQTVEGIYMPVSATRVT